MVGPVARARAVGGLRRAARYAVRLLVTICLLWAVVRLGGFPLPWPLSALLAGTVWMIPVCLVGLLAAVLVRDRWTSAVAALAALGLVAVVAPRAWGSGDRRDGPQLRVMTANLRVGGADAVTLVQLVRDRQVDLLAVQELTPQAQARLAAAGLDGLLPFHLTDAAPLAIGSALYARWPLTDVDTPVASGGFVEATATLRLAGAAPVVVRSVHPCAPYTAAHQRCWRQDLTNEPRADAAGPQRLLLGDFNATLDHPELRQLIRSGYRDAAASVGAGLEPTWPADRLPVVTLDHVLADARIGVRQVSLHQITGSDHRAVFAVLTLTRS